MIFRSKLIHNIVALTSEFLPEQSKFNDLDFELIDRHIEQLPMLKDVLVYIDERPLFQFGLIFLFLLFFKYLAFFLIFKKFNS